MSQSVHRRIGILLVVLLAAGPPGYGEVTSRGFGAFQKPPVADQPSEEYIADEYAHDVADGVVFDLTDHYELRQGADDDNKQRWKDTDWIHWAVHGATLRARGQVHDGDHRQATIANSEAWGAEYVEATVGADEGDKGTITAENRISFRYSYLVSGAYVGEASVQLNAVAYDLKHKDHSFHLNEQSGESVESDEETRTDSEFRVKLSGGKTLVVSDQGAEGKLESEAELEYENGERLDVRIGRRFRQSSGDGGSSPTVTVRDEVKGDTPLEAHYEVFSEGDVTLRARAGRVPGSGESSVVVVKLNEFRVENTLRVWTSATWSRPPPGDDPGDVPPVSNPDPTGPTTPGGGAGGSTGGDTGDGDGDGDGAQQATQTDGSEDGIRRTTLPLDADEPVDAHAVCVAPDGLADEPGSRAGRLRIRLTAPAPRDLRFTVATDPPGVLETAATELVVAEGETIGGLYLHGAAPGHADAILRYVDETGAVTGTVLVVPVEAVSVTARLAPRLWAALPGGARADERGTTLRALVGSDPGALRIGRGGFVGFADSATGVRLAVDDPAGVLAALPDRVEIAAGTEWIDVPLALGGAAGAATITLLGDDGQRIPVRVRSVGQAWSSVPRVRVPVGARVHVPLLFAEAEPGGRPLFAASDDEGCVRVGRIDEVAAGARLAGVWVEAVASGATVLRVNASGLPELTVALEAVARQVRVAPDRLEVDAVDAATGGEIVLRLPRGARVAALDVPAELGEFVEVRGVGTDTVVLAFLPAPDLPDALSLPIRFEGTPPGPFFVDVLDSVHGGAEDILHTVRLPVG